jgi:hypothetical protein
MKDKKDIDDSSHTHQSQDSLKQSDSEQLIAILGYPIRLSLLKSFGVAVFYAVSSMFLSLFNKSLLSSFAFNGYFLLLAYQMAFSLFLCVVSRDFFGNPFKIPAYDYGLHKGSLLLGTLYVANVGAGLIGLQLVNIPLFLCIRRLTTPTILLYDFVARKKVQSKEINASIFFIFAGTIIAGYETLTADLFGYAVTMLNNLFTAASMAFQKDFFDKNQGVKLTAFGVLYFNSLTALPLAFFLSLVTSEISNLGSFAHVESFTFWVNFVIAGSLGPILTYSSVLSTTYNSPLSTSVTGTAKDICLTVAGALSFSDFQATTTNVFGILLSFIGTGIYSWYSLQGLSAKQGTQASSDENKEGGGGGSSGAGGGDMQKIGVSSSSRDGENSIESGDGEVSEKASFLAEQGPRTPKTK